MWVFKHIKRIFFYQYLRTVASRNLFVEFIHEVQNATRLPIERMQKVFKVY